MDNSKLSGEKVKGIIPPVITPFDSHGKFDPKRMEDFLNFLKQKVMGMFVCGTYGSGPLMNVSERKQVLETVMRVVGDSIPVIAHVGSSNPNDVFELAQHAEQAGAAAVASVPPFYYATSYYDEDLKRFFAKLIDTVDIPVFLYNNPKTVGISISIDLLEQLHNEGLAGVKDSSFDLSNFYKCKYRLDLHQFKYIIGTEMFIVPTIPLGAVASISGLANAFPELVVHLYEAIENREYKRAFELQEQVNYAREVQHMAQSIPAIHTLLEFRGIDVGYPRHPYSKVEPQVKDKMKDAIKKLGILS